MTRRHNLLAIHGMGAFIVVLGGGLLINGWVPPPSPHASTAAIASIFQVPAGDRIRIGSAILFVGAPLFCLPAVAIANQMKRIEGPVATWAKVQMLMSTCGVLAVQIPAAFWLAASYRRTLSAPWAAALNDIAWFFMLAAVGPLFVQMASLGICVLQGDGTVYPRWFGYLSVWLASLELGGAAIPFFQTGPLAWNGLLGWWLVALAFFCWAPTAWVLTVAAINRWTSSADATGTPAAVPA